MQNIFFHAKHKMHDSNPILHFPCFIGVMWFNYYFFKNGMGYLLQGCSHLNLKEEMGTCFLLGEGNKFF